MLGVADDLGRSAGLGSPRLQVAEEPLPVGGAPAVVVWVKAEGEITIAGLQFEPETMSWNKAAELMRLAYVCFLADRG